MFTKYDWESILRKVERFMCKTLSRNCFTLKQWLTKTRFSYLLTSFEFPSCISGLLCKTFIICLNHYKSPHLSFTELVLLWQVFSDIFPNRWFLKAGGRGGLKLVLKRIMIYAQVGGTSLDTCSCTAGVCPPRLWGWGFNVGCFFFFCLSSHKLHRHVLAKPYIASSCCVILNQWALILLLKHCGLYWGGKMPMTFKAVCFDGVFCFVFRRVGGWVG